MAVTLVNNLFPPIVDTYMPAFLHYNKGWVTFSIPKYNSALDIRHIQLSLVDQFSNLYALQDTYIPSSDAQSESSYLRIINHILIIDFDAYKGNGAEDHIFWYDEQNDTYTVAIDPTWLTANNNSKYRTALENLSSDDWKSKTEEPNFKTSQYYQVQLRFDDATPPSSGKWDKSWLVNQRDHFSEWSEVCLIKPIPDCRIILNQFDIFQGDGSTGPTIPSFHKGLTRITGHVAWGARYDNSSGQDEEKQTEHLQTYKLQVYDETGSILIFETEEFIAQPQQNVLNNENFDMAAGYPINCLLDLDRDEIFQDTQYYLKVIATTNNGYVFTSDIKDSDTEVPFNFKIKIYDTSEHFDNACLIATQNEEDGYVDLHFMFSQYPETFEPGKLYIRRTSSLSNFKEWELISQTHHSNQYIDITLQDYTVASLIRYQYSIQFEYDNGTWTKRYYHFGANGTHDEAVALASGMTYTEFLNYYNITPMRYIYPTFYDIILHRQGRQLAVRYNGQVPNMNPVINRQKIDTLGGKYPKFAENALMNYRQFNISGLISSESDFNRKFLSEVDSQFKDDMDYYDNYFGQKYSLRNDTKADGVYTYGGDNIGNIGNKGIPEKEDTIPIERITTDHYPDRNGSPAYNKQLDYQHDIYPMDNWYWERRFRDEVVKWLNDGEPKLFKSKPEGNIAVMLTDIQLTSEATLGRRLYSFSATAYEVGDGYSLDSLASLGIIKVPTVNPIRTSEDIEVEIDDDETISMYVTKPMQITTNTIHSLNDLSPWNEGWYGSRKSILDRDLGSYWTEKYASGTLLENRYPDFSSIVMNNVKIQFLNEPKWYIKKEESGHYTYTEIKTDNSNTTSTNGLLNSANNENDTNSGEQILFGYVIYVRVKNVTWDEGVPNAVSLDVTTDKPGGTWYKPIFINHRGYYEFPNDVNLGDIRLLDEKDIVNIDFLITYKKTVAKNVVAYNQEILEDIVGQWDGLYEPNTPIGDKVRRKHNKILISRNKVNAKTIERYSQVKIEMTKWSGICLDVTPYAVFDIKTLKTKNAPWHRFYVGRTGRFHLDPDFECYDLKFMGARLYENKYIKEEDFTIQSFPSKEREQQAFQDWTSMLDDWEYATDVSAEPFDESKLYNNLYWINFSNMENLDTAVTINDENNLIFNKWINYLDSQSDIDTLVEIKAAPEIYGYLSTEDVINPTKNTIYGFYDTLTKTKIQKLHYMNGDWYDFEIQGEPEDGVILAKMPVQGMINYKGSLWKGEYDI